MPYLTRLACNRTETTGTFLQGLKCIYIYIFMLDEGSMLQISDISDAWEMIPMGTWTAPSRYTNGILLTWAYKGRSGGDFRVGIERMGISKGYYPRMLFEFNASRLRRTFPFTFIPSIQSQTKLHMRKPPPSFLSFLSSLCSRLRFVPKHSFIYSSCLNYISTYLAIR